MINFKKLLFLALLYVSFGLEAHVLTTPGSVTPGVLNADGSSLNGTFSEPVAGAFNIDIDFDVINAPATGVPGSATVVSVQLEIPGITNIGVDPLSFSAMLDGVALTINDLGSVLLGTLTSNLTNGSHILNLTGTTKPDGATLSGSINIQAVPIPATVWLFGSAIACLFRFRFSKPILG
jgi:hypothetical protein